MSKTCRILAIETSGRTGSVALLEADQIIAEQLLPASERTARTLVPALQSLLTDAGDAPTDLSAVVVGMGPGSFTGLRIGVTAAKTFAYATGCKLVGVNTLDVLAAQAGKLASSGRVWAVLNAERGDLFVACYDTLPADWGTSDPTQLLSADDWLGQLGAGDVVVGHAAARYTDRLPSDVVTLEESTHFPRAATVGSIGAQMLARGQACDPFQLTPRYHRASAAEEKRRT